FSAGDLARGTSDPARDVHHAPGIWRRASDPGAASPTAHFAVGTGYAFAQRRGRDDPDSASWKALVFGQHHDSCHRCGGFGDYANIASHADRWHPDGVVWLSNSR